MTRIDSASALLVDLGRIMTNQGRAHDAMPPCLNWGWTIYTARTQALTLCRTRRRSTQRHIVYSACSISGRGWTVGQENNVAEAAKAQTREHCQTGFTGATRSCERR